MASSDRPHPLPFQRLALATVALSLVLVGLGGAVRATGSGLACPDWPFCYGKVVPRHADIPDGSGYTLWNVWLEHSHRLVAGLVGVLVAWLAIWALRHHRRRPWVLWPVVAAGVAVVVQMVLGALVVLHLLRAELVTAHLGMAMIIIASLMLAATGADPREPVQSPAGRSLVVATWILALGVLTQVLVGGHVTGIAAGLVYGTDPFLFDGAVVPTVRTSAEAYHVLHRVLAYLLAAGAVAVWLLARRARSTRPGGRLAARVAGLVVALVATQVGLGFANLWFRTPPAIVTAHLTVASWIWAATVALMLVVHGRLARLPPTDLEPIH